MAQDVEDETTLSTNFVHRMCFLPQGREDGFEYSDDFDKNSNEVKIQNWLCENDPPYATFFAEKSFCHFVSLSSSPCVGATSPLQAFRPERDHRRMSEGEEGERSQPIYRTPEPEPKHFYYRHRSYRLTIVGGGNNESASDDDCDENSEISEISEISERDKRNRSLR